MSISINTEAVRQAAGEIDKVNKQLLNDFDAVEAAVKQLEKEWTGAGLDGATSSFRNIKSSYVMDRFKIVSDLTAFMRNQVGGSYESVESAVSRVASAFK